MLAIRRPSLVLPLIVVVFALFACGCAGARGPEETGGGETTEGRGEAPAPPTTMTTMMFQSFEPPGSTLSYGGDAVEGGLGTYCWGTGGGGGCLDAFGVVLGDETLEAPAGATLSFAYEGRDLDSLEVSAYRAGSEGPGGNPDKDVFVPRFGGGGNDGAKDLEVRRSGTRARVVADLPADEEYVLEAFATMPQGDVSYGFRLIVE